MECNGTPDLGDVAAEVRRRGYPRASVDDTGGNVMCVTVPLGPGHYGLISNPQDHGVEMVGVYTTEGDYAYGTDDQVRQREESYDAASYAQWAVDTLRSEVAKVAKGEIYVKRFTPAKEARECGFYGDRQDWIIDYEWTASFHDWLYKAYPNEDKQRRIHATARAMDEDELAEMSFEEIAEATWPRTCTPNGVDTLLAKLDGTPYTFDTVEPANDLSAYVAKKYSVKTSVVSDDAMDMDPPFYVKVRL
jgi:hypothetical protein